MGKVAQCVVVCRVVSSGPCVNQHTYMHQVHEGVQLLPPVYFGNFERYGKDGRGLNLLPQFHKENQSQFLEALKENYSRKW